MQRWPRCSHLLRCEQKDGQADVSRRHDREILKDGAAKADQRTQTRVVLDGRMQRDGASLARATEDEPRGVALEQPGLAVKDRVEAFRLRSNLFLRLRNGRVEVLLWLDWREPRVRAAADAAGVGHQAQRRAHEDEAHVVSQLLVRLAEAAVGERPEAAHRPKDDHSVRVRPLLGVELALAPIKLGRAVRARTSRERRRLIGDDGATRRGFALLEPAVERVLHLLKIDLAVAGGVDLVEELVDLGLRDRRRRGVTG